jgi:hypothetical protein
MAVIRGIVMKRKRIAGQGRRGFGFASSPDGLRIVADRGGSLTKT